MKREPNPYAKQRTYTVTQTMAISVPSVVVEDVLDGTDTPAITVDPEVNERIDAISEVVDLMDTRINAVSEVANLTNTNLHNLAEVVDVINTRVDNVSKVASLEAGDATLTIDQIIYSAGIGAAATEYRDSHGGLTNVDSGQVYEVVTIRDSESEAVYPIAALGFVCPETDNTGIYWQKTGQQYELQYTSDGGRTWTSLTGSSGSVSTLSGFAGAYKDYDSTVLDYKLGLDLDPRTNQLYLIAKNGSGVNWKPLQLGSGSLASVTTKSDKLYRLEFSQENSFMYALSQQYSSSELAYCNGIACNYFRDPAGAASWLHHTEMRFQKNTSTGALEIQLRGDKDHSWITVASTADTSSSGSTSNTVTFGPFGPSQQYELSLELSGGRTDQYSAVVELRSDNYPGDAALGTYLAAPGDNDYERSVLMAVSGMGALVFKSHDKVVKYDLNNLGGSSESEGDMSFSTSGGTNYNLGFEVDKNADDHSVIVSLTSTGSNEFSGITALSTWLNCPSYGIGDTHVFMAVSGVGTLVFNSHGSITTYDLNNLGGSGSTSGNYLPVSGAIDSLCLYPTHDNATTYLSTSRRASRVLRFGPSSTDVVYGLQTALAAIGTQGKPGSQVIDAGAVQMALVQGASASSEPHFVWWNNAMSQYSKWEPWKEAGSSSSGSTSGSAAGVFELGLLDNGSDSGSRMLPLISSPNLTSGTNVELLSWAIGSSTSDAQDTSGMFTLVGNPIALYDSAYRESGSSHIKGAVRVVDMHGKICWQRYSYTAKQWMIEEKDPSFYWQETNKSTTSIVAVLSYPGYGETSAILINNPLYAGQYNSRPCAVRPYISSDGTLLSWKRRTESGDWTDVKSSSSDGSSNTLCLYTKKLANTDSGTSVSSISASVGYGFNWNSSTDLGYLIINRQGVDHQISLHDLNWLLSNKAKLVELLK